MSAHRAYRAGESIEDFCRVCKTDRLHTVIVVGEGGAPLRVVCGYCSSQHNYRGGPRVESETASVSRPSASSGSPGSRSILTASPHHVKHKPSGISFPASATAKGWQHL